MRIIDARGKWLIPGVIDDQVHFREPGLTHKADLATESRAAVAGGVTSFMDMPNTLPQTTSLDALKWKWDRAAETSVANYSFYIGATNDNANVLRQADFSKVCGIKIFLGSSTGNMLVNKKETLKRIFSLKIRRLSPYIAKKKKSLHETGFIIHSVSEKNFRSSFTLLSAVPKLVTLLHPKL